MERRVRHNMEELVERIPDRVVHSTVHLLPGEENEGVDDDPPDRIVGSHENHDDDDEQKHLDDDEYDGGDDAADENKKKQRVDDGDDVKKKQGSDAAADDEQGGDDVKKMQGGDDAGQGGDAVGKGTSVVDRRVLGKGRVLTAADRTARALAKKELLLYRPYADREAFFRERGDLMRFRHAVSAAEQHTETLREGNRRRAHRYYERHRADILHKKKETRLLQRKLLFQYHSARDALYMPLNVNFARMFVYLFCHQSRDRVPRIGTVNGHINNLHVLAQFMPLEVRHTQSLSSYLTEHSSFTAFIDNIVNNRVQSRRPRWQLKWQLPGMPVTYSHRPGRVVYSRGTRASALFTLLKVCDIMQLLRGGSNLFSVIRAVSQTFHDKNVKLIAHQLLHRPFLDYEHYLVMVERAYGRMSPAYVLARIYQLYGFRDDLQLVLCDGTDTSVFMAEGADVSLRNVLAVPKEVTRNAFIKLNVYKTVEIYHRLTLELDEGLTALLRRYIHHELNRNYYFKGEPARGDYNQVWMFGRDKLSSEVVMMNKYLHLDAGITTLRKMRIARYRPDFDSQPEAVNHFAVSSFHSVQVENEVYLSQSKMMSYPAATDLFWRSHPGDHKKYRHEFGERPHVDLSDIDSDLDLFAIVPELALPADQSNEYYVKNAMRIDLELPRDKTEYAMSIYEVIQQIRDESNLDASKITPALLKHYRDQVDPCEFHVYDQYMEAKRKHPNAIKFGLIGTTVVAVEVAVRTSTRVSKKTQKAKWSQENDGKSDEELFGDSDPQMMLRAAEKEEKLLKRAMTGVKKKRKSGDDDDDDDYEDATSRYDTRMEHLLEKFQHETQNSEFKREYLDMLFNMSDEQRDKQRDAYQAGNRRLQASADQIHALTGARPPASTSSSSGASPPAPTSSSSGARPPASTSSSSGAAPAKLTTPLAKSKSSSSSSSSSAAATRSIELTWTHSTMKSARVFPTEQDRMQELHRDRTKGEWDYPSEHFMHKDTRITYAKHFEKAYLQMWAREHKRRQRAGARVKSTDIASAIEIPTDDLNGVIGVRDVLVADHASDIGLAVALAEGVAHQNKGGSSAVANALQINAEAPINSLAPEHVDQDDDDDDDDDDEEDAPASGLVRER